MIRTITGVLFLVAGSIFLFLARYQYQELQFELNDRLAEAEKFEPLFWTPLTWMKFKKLYRRVLPNSPRPKRARVLTVIGFGSFVIAITLLRHIQIFQ